MNQLKTKFLNFLDKIGRKRVIMDRLCAEPYLERYYIFLKERKYFPFNVFIHKFLRGDPDQPHDHPWPYATLILAGGYYEWVPVFENGQMIDEVRYWRGPGHFRINSANSYHRIELKKDTTAWTMFMPGPHKRNWGFLVDNVWVPNEKYLADKAARMD